MCEYNDLYLQAGRFHFKESSSRQSQVLWPRSEKKKKKNICTAKQERHMKGTGLGEYYLCDINTYSYSEVKPCTDISLFLLILCSFNTHFLLLLTLFF